MQIRFNLSSPPSLSRSRSRSRSRSLAPSQSLPHSLFPSYRSPTRSLLTISILFPKSFIRYRTLFDLRSSSPSSPLPLHFARFFRYVKYYLFIDSLDGLTVFQSASAIYVLEHFQYHFHCRIVYISRIHARAWFGNEAGHSPGEAYVRLSSGGNSI